jgi:hypothetical protein
MLLLSMVLCLSGLPETVAAQEKSTARGTRTNARSSKTDRKTDKKKEAGKGKDAKAKEEEKKQESLFLAEPDENQAYVPEIFRCGECGYEQDEPGNCPDHALAPLTLVLSKGKNPLEPTEVDGNEDLLVDIPLTGLAFKKAGAVGSDSATLSAVSGAPSPGAVGVSGAPALPLTSAPTESAAPGTSAAGDESQAPAAPSQP